MTPEIDLTFGEALKHLSPVFGKSTRLEIVLALVVSDEELTASEIIDTTTLSRGGVYNNIDDLVDDGVIQIDRNPGNRKYYAPNMEHPVVKHFPQLLNSTA